jgi:hypothetical protein
MKGEKPKAKFIRERQALRKAGRDVRLARIRFDEQIQTGAKSLCRPLCEATHDRLPPELRDMITRNRITGNSATFIPGKDGKIAFSNGTLTLQHAFEEEYTGTRLHTDIIQELMRQSARFDFRARHDLLGKVFKHYAVVEHGRLDLPSKIKKLSLVVTAHHLRYREVVLAHLEQISNISKGADIYFMVEAGSSTQAQIAHRVRRVLRMMFSLLERLHKLELHIHVCVNPPYSVSKVKNSDDSTFSVAHEGPVKYEMTPENANFTVEGFEKRLRDLFREYGEYWDSRFPPRDR